jgi:filamentous hemagglutinin family protein
MESLFLWIIVFKNLSIMFKHYIFQFFGISLAWSTASLTCTPVLAQIIPDNSLGSENSLVTPNVTIKDNLADLIEGGAIRGNNLFHSFEQFNVGDGAAIYFANPDGIANILTRVTGNHISEIFGTLGVDGAANLFLLNPNGIVFGENAALDVNGSFFATTADSYIFNNSFEYSASNAEAPPLLTINIPIGLQFGSNSEGIVNRSQILNDAEEIAGLEVQPQENLTLVGGDISFEGGQATASNGRIEIGSVAANSFVEIIPTENNWTLGYEEINNFQDISLTQGASISTNGDGAGNINIQANKLSVLEGSFIAANNLGEIDGGSLSINATESITIAGTDVNNSPSYISTDVFNSGDGANINIKTRTLELKDGAGISAYNYGQGDGGNLNILASDFVSLIGREEGGYSYISTDVFNSGNAGNLSIETGTLEVKDRTFISSDVLIDGGVLDMGDGGNVTIKASDSVEVAGTDTSAFDNKISTAVYLFTDTPLEELNLEPNSANGGNLRIETGTLRVANGGIVTTDNFGSGKGGSLTINASELVEVVGNSAEDIQSFISTSVYGTADGGDFTINTGTLRIVDDAYVDSITYAQGNGGTLTVNADLVIVKDGGQLAVGIFGGQGNAGNLIINATESVEVSGASRLRRNEVEGEVFFDTSSVFASAVSEHSGNGGNIIIETPTLKLFDGGGISTSTNSAGNAGNIIIRANTIEVANRIQDSFAQISGINSLVSTEGTGNGGSIDIVADRLQIVDGGLISVDSLGKGNAGNIKVNAENIHITGVSSGEPFFGVKQESVSSTISAFSEGDFAAGSINIDSNTLNISDRGLISVNNLGNGNSGSLNIIANQLNLDNSATIEAKVNAGSQGNINLTTDNLFLRNNSEINAKATGTATGGNIDINNTDNIVLLENSKIIADAIQGNGGNINITTQGYFVSPDSKISASSELGLDGNINIENLNGDRQFELDRLPENIQDSTNLIAVSCSSNDNNAFAVIGNGGIPNSPYSTQSLNATWYDLRPLKEKKATVTSTPPVLQEANTTIINSDGEIELVALNPLSNYPWVKSSCQK